MSQLLVILVAVLGTVVGMILVSAALWACIKWRKKGRKGRFCWHVHRGQSQSHDAYGFPPHRDVIELGCIHGTGSFMGHQRESTVYNNNTGVSRGLGLGASNMMGQLPALPAPRSWTPSPPFDSQKISVHSRSSAPQKGVDLSHLSRSRRNTPLNPERLNNIPMFHRGLTINKHSTSHNVHTDSKSCRKCLQMSAIRPDFVDVSLGSGSSDDEPRMEEVDLSSHSLKARFSGLANFPAHKTQEHYVPQHEAAATSAKSISKMQHYGLGSTGQDPNGYTGHSHYSEHCNDQPLACSSNCGSPLRESQPVSLSSLEHAHYTHCGDRQQDANTSSKHHKISPRKEVGCRKKYSSFERTHKSVHVLPKIVETSASFDSTSGAITKSPVMFAEHHTNRYQDHDRLHPRNAEYYSEYYPSTSRRDEINARKSAEKYCFCQSCENYPEAHRTVGGVQQITRGTQTHWRRYHSQNTVKNRDTTGDPTPSLSWDNLTPAPSPVLTYTIGDTADDFGINGNGRIETMDIHEDSDNKERNDNSVFYPEQENSEEGAVGGW